MDILYDGMIFSMQKAGGINRYFANIISRLPDNDSPTLTTRRDLGVNVPAHPHLSIKRYHPFRPHQISQRLEKAYFRSLEQVHRYQVAHPTYYSLLTRQEFGCYRCPVVVTVYDMIHELFPQDFQGEGQQDVWKQKKQAVERADAILCISENTKQDLLRFHPSVEHKVVVTYLAADMDICAAQGLVPERPYFLFVGGRNSYKNFDGLLAALSQVVPRYPDVCVCVVGAPFSEAETQTIETLGLAAHFEHCGLAGDRQLAKLYNRSLALIYPSRYEGFGIPPLEAMACETVVVGADVSSVPEVVGDAGLLFDPDSSDLTDILLALLGGSVDRDDLIQKGRQRARHFSWDKTAAQTVEVYRKIA